MNEALNWIASRSKREGNKTAIIDSERLISWRQLDHSVDHMCYSLLQQQVDAGDVIAAISKNNLELVVLYLASLKVGASMAFIAPAPISQLNKKFEVLDCDHVWFGRHAPDGLNSESVKIDVNILDLELVLSPYSGEAIEPREHPLHIASLIFTSGSTGTPKAVAHRASQHIASAQGLLEKLHFTSSDTWLLSLPMYHVSGLAILWRWLTVGACLKVGRGDDLYTDLIQATHASLVPTQLKRLLEDGRPLSLSRVLLGGSHIPLSLAQEAKRRGIDTWLGYGMTEAASTVTAKQVDEHAGVGYLLPHRKIALQGNRIFIGGETLACGYYQRGSITPIVHDGWFDSKDLGQWHGQELRILGRADNQFISGGENIHCEEIESVLLAHPDIHQAFVIPVEDAEYGARPIAVVTSDTSLTHIKLDTFLLDKLEKFKWPIDYVLLPKSTLNHLNRGGIKLSRSAVKEWFFQNQTQ